MTTIKINNWVKTHKNGFASTSIIKLEPFDYKGKLISGIKVEGQVIKEQFEKFTPNFTQNYSTGAAWKAVEIELNESEIEVKRPAPGYGHENYLVLKENAVRGLKEWELPTEFRFKLTELGDARDGIFKIKIGEKGLVENSYTPKVNSINMPFNASQVGDYDVYLGAEPHKDKDLIISNIRWTSKFLSQPVSELEGGKLVITSDRGNAIPKLKVVGENPEFPHPDKKQAASQGNARQRVSKAITRAGEAKRRLFKFGYINDSREDFQEAVSAINEVIKIAKNGSEEEKKEYKTYMPWQENGTYFKELKDCIYYTSINNGKEWKYNLDTGAIDWGSTNQSSPDQGKQENDSGNDKKRKNENEDNNHSREPKRTKIEEEIKQNQAKSDEENYSKLANDLTNFNSKNEAEKKQSLADIERLKNQGGVYESQKEQVKEKKDEAAKSDPRGYGKMIAQIIRQKINEFKVEITKLGEKINTKLAQLENGEVTSDTEVRIIEEEISEEVSQEVANVETNNLLTQAQNLLKGASSKLRSQLKEVKNGLWSLKISINPYQQKAYQSKKKEIEQTLGKLEIVSQNTNQPTKSSSPFRPEVIIPVGLGLLMITVVVTALIIRNKQVNRNKK